MREIITTFSVTIPDYTKHSLEQDRVSPPPVASTSTSYQRYGKNGEPLRTKETVDEFFGTIDASTASLAPFAEYDYMLLAGPNDE